jgi:hypothetical protein
MGMAGNPAGTVSTAIGSPPQAVYGKLRTYGLLKFEQDEMSLFTPRFFSARSSKTLGFAHNGRELTGLGFVSYIKG